MIWNITFMSCPAHYRLRRLCAACTLLMTLLSVSVVWARPVARMKNVKGPVQVRAAGSARFKAARERQTISLGDTVRTGARGRTEIVLSNGTRVVILQKMQVEVTPQWLNPVRARPTKVKPRPRPRPTRGR